MSAVVKTVSSRVWWFKDEAGKASGPHSIGSLKRLFTHGTLTHTSPVRKEGSDWCSLLDFPMLAKIVDFSTSTLSWMSSAGLSHHRSSTSTSVISSRVTSVEPIKPSLALLTHSYTDTSVAEASTDSEVKSACSDDVSSPVHSSHVENKAEVERITQDIKDGLLDLPPLPPASALGRSLSGTSLETQVSSQSRRTEVRRRRMGIGLRITTSSDEKEASDCSSDSSGFSAGIEFRSDAGMVGSSHDDREVGDWVRSRSPSLIKSDAPPPPSVFLEFDGAEQKMEDVFSDGEIITMPRVPPNTPFSSSSDLPDMFPNE